MKRILHGNGSKVAPKCDPESGSPVFFDCGSFTLAEGGVIDAEAAGYNWVKFTGSAPADSKVSGSWYTFAPGPSGNYQGFLIKVR